MNFVGVGRKTAGAIGGKRKELCEGSGKCSFPSAVSEGETLLIMFAD